MVKLGEGVWVHEDYLTYLRQPKDIDIILFCKRNSGAWMAIAPEWQCALGFGMSLDEAAEDLQSKLLETKLLYIDEKIVEDIKQIPIDFKGKRARRIRQGLCDGRPDIDAEEKAYFDEREKDASIVVWRTIQV